MADVVHFYISILPLDFVKRTGGEPNEVSHGCAGILRELPEPAECALS